VRPLERDHCPASVLLVGVVIDINRLTESDIGRTVIYEPNDSLLDFGRLTSWNETFVFVQFSGPGGEACNPEDVRLVVR